MAQARLPVHADTVLLRNGDRLTGTVINVSTDTLKLKTSYAGEFKIKRGEITSMSTDEAVTLMIGDDMVRGRLGAADGIAVELSREDGSADTVPLEQLTYVKPTPEQGGPGVRYQGINLGLSRATGNTDNERSCGDGEFTARTKDYRWAVAGNGRYSQDDGETSESNWLLLGNYDWFFRPRQFLYARTSFEHNQFTDVDLQSTVGGGYGYQLLENDTTNLSLQGGLDYVDIRRDQGDDEDYPAAGWGISYDQKLWDGKVVLFHLQQGYWSLEQSEDVQIRTRSGLRFPLEGGFNATAQLNLDGDNNPAPGRKTTDET